MLGKLALTRSADEATDFDATRWEADVLRYAFFRLGSIEGAEDVAAQVMRDAHRQRRKIGSTQDPRLYLIGMGRRRVADVLRKRGRNPFARSLDDPAFTSPSTDGDMAAAGRRLLVGSVLRRLPDAEREVLALKYLHDLPAEEIATLMDRTVPAINSLLQRARQAFAHAAGDDFEKE